MVIVRLARLENSSAASEERTYTNNVSAHGACVISAHAWQHGEEAVVTSVKDEIAMRGRVVYCQELDGHQFAIGLNFPEQVVQWSSYKKYDGFDAA